MFFRTDEIMQQMIKKLLGLELTVLRSLQFIEQASIGSGNTLRLKLIKKDINNKMKK